MCISYNFCDVLILNVIPGISFWVILYVTDVLQKCLT